MMNPTKKAISTKLLDEVLGEKVQLVCKQHNYVAGARHGQAKGCYQCIYVDFVYKFCKTKPENRAEMLDQFEAIVRAMCELEDEGKLDIHLYPHPIVEITKDAS